MAELSIFSSRYVVAVTSERDEASGSFFLTIPVHYFAINNVLLCSYVFTRTSPKKTFEHSKQYPPRPLQSLPRGRACFVLNASTLEPPPHHEWAFDHLAQKKLASWQAREYREGPER